MNENFGLFLSCLLPMVFIYIFIANKLGNSWFNPLLFNIFTAGIGLGVALFLYVLNYATFPTFCYVIISSFIYWSFLLKNFPRDIRPPKVMHQLSKKYESPVFWFMFWYSIISTLFSYYMFGIPLLNSINSDDITRLDTYVNSGGFGIILRLSDFPKMLCLFYGLGKYFKKVYSFKKMLILFSPFIIFGILSGSRSSFLIYLFAFWGYKLFYEGEEIYLKNYKKLIIPTAIISLLTFACQQSFDHYNTIYSFLERIVGCGDLYWYALPDDLWKSMSINNPIKDIFVGLLAPMRLMSSAGVDRPLGFQLTTLVYDWDLSSGPVELFPISSLAYFGYYGGIIMVIIQAILTCYFFKKFYRRSNNLIEAAFYFYGFYTCTYFVGSLRDSMGQLFNMLATYIFLKIVLTFVTFHKNRI